MSAYNKKLKGVIRGVQLIYLSQLLGGVVLVLGFVVMVGWLFHIPILTRVYPSFIPMKFNTAILFALSGFSILNLPLHTSFKRILPWVILIFASLILSQYVTGWNLGIDELFVQDTTTTYSPGRISGIAAINFIFVSRSLMLMAHYPRRSHFNAFVVCIVALVVLAGYLYHVPAFYQMYQFSAMAVHTAAGFLLVSIALLLANTQSPFMQMLVSDSAGAKLIRQVLPITLLLLIVLNVVFILGDTLGLYPNDFVMPLNVASTVIALIIIISSLAGHWHETDLRRIAAEEQLRQSYEHLEQQVQERTAELSLYKTAVEASSEQIIMVDNDYRFVAVNDAYLQYRPYDRHAIIGKSLREITGETLFDSTLQPMFTRALNGETVTYETTIDYPTMGIRHVLANYSPLRDPDSLVIGVVGIIHDITERQQMELTLRENEHKLQTLFEMLPVGVALINKERQAVQMNPMMERILDLSLEEWNSERKQGRHYLYPDNTPMPVSQLPSELAIREQCQIFDMEVGIVKSDNKTIWTSVNAAPLQIADSAAVLVVQDITQRKQVERALEASMEYLSMLTHALADGIMTVDIHTRTIQFVNQRFCEIFGYSEDELMGQPTRIFYGDDEAHAAFGAKLQQAISTGQLPLITERELRRKTGECFWTSTATSTLTLDGKVTEAISIVRDITERKLAEEQARRLEIEQRNVKNLREFITNISHDLKTPITQIITSVYLLKRSLADDSQHRRITAIETHTNNLRKIIDAIVLMSELDAKDAFEFSPVDGKLLLADLITSFVPNTEQKNQQFTLQCMLDSMVLQADSEYLQLALRRIIENAIYYTPDGGSVTVSTSQRANDYIIEIQDTGSGIASEDLPHIFEHFYRADKARSIGEGHTGMGLAITHKIIKAHGGRIEVTSQLHQGSTFRVFLPATSL